MKTFLYRLLSVQTFIQLKNDKVFGVSNLFFIMSVCIAIAGIPVGMKLGWGESFPYTIPFIIIFLLGVTHKLTTGVVSKEIQDKYWQTQLVRFKNPKYRAQRAAYPGDADARERALEEMWENKYGVSFDDTQAPYFQKIRIVLLPGFAIIGVLIGVLIRIL